ncbi:uncharacterized protein LOC130767727 isoform X2 [Actinidia eriantha]|uniref:uncharacterized protein LOC130767727 isoform X2 n=1 Tax=Actinidia eriantha TaxID=165200 RepID=UPI002589EC59|nr:uncharacterized protein LOC130767727 isoform X2 [Actinidia eriantha]
MEVHSEDNNTPPEKSKKRRFKTPSQVEALEKFYSEHKYPSEEMKSEIAGSLRLTEKQVSGWFCHRRLKDKNSQHGEAPANGRQDRSSGIVQEHVSGHRQDSCSSTKQGNNRHFNPKELESRRFTGQDYSAADLAYEHGHDPNGNDSDTSSESSLPLQYRVHHQNGDPFDMATSRYLPQDENMPPINSMGIRPRIGPSGYLKVKVPVENAAITAVKRQLGRHYREGGPALGVEFEPLPPGAFESSNKDPVNEPCHLGDPDLRPSPDFSRICSQPNTSMRYQVYNSKMSSQDADLEGSSFKIMRRFDPCENSIGHQPKPKPILPNRTNPFPGWNSSIEMDEASAGEIPVYGSCKMRANPDLEGRRRVSVSRHHPHPYGYQVTGGQREEPWLCDTYDVTTEDAHREHFESKYSNITRKPRESLDMKDIELSRRMAKEDKLYGERRATMEYRNPARVMVHPTNEMRVANGCWDEFPQQQCAKEALMGERRPWTNTIKRTEVNNQPSSFSEDETAEASSSLD